jgi:hypothetical protein
LKFNRKDKNTGKMENDRLQSALDKITRGKHQILYSDKKDGESGYELYLEAMRD